MALKGKPRYSLCREKATDLLLLQSIHSVIIDARELILRSNIRFSSFELYSEVTQIPIKDLTSDERLKDGFTLKHARGYLILYDGSTEKWFPQRLRFSLAHELGHVYLGHEEDGEIEEKEANCFASQLLAPDVVLERVLKRFDSADIEATRNTFGLSWEAAEIKVKSVENKLRYYGFSSERRDMELVQKYAALPRQRAYIFPNCNTLRQCEVPYIE